MVLALILMSLPCGIPTGPQKYKEVFYQQFTTSFFHVSYESNWFPIITALLSIAVLLILVISYVKKKHYMGKVTLIFVSVCIVASPLSWLIYGIEYTITWIGIIVFLLHVVTLVLLVKSKKSNV
jgi:hypothetical protein